MITRAAKTEEGSRMGSAATVLGHDMVTEILLCLPPESIFTYRSVSKQWNSLLTSPEFLSHYSKLFRRRQRTRPSHHLLGFFLRPEYTLGAPTMPFLSTHPRISHENFSSDLGFYITSCNGLVLCGCRDRGSYHILNPVTHKHVSLPPPGKHLMPRSIGLSCDEGRDDLTPRYEVVIADIDNKGGVNNKLRIETYSSETKEWRESLLVANSDFSHISVRPPKVLNGVFYCWVKFDCLAAYDMHNKQGRNKDRNHLQLIKLPANPGYSLHNKHVLNQTPDGRLIFGRTLDGLIQIWELSKRELEFWRETTITEQEWVLIYEARCMTDLVLVDIATWDPLILVVMLRRGVFQYYPETKRMQHIVSIPEKELPDEPFFGPLRFHLISFLDFWFYI